MFKFIILIPLVENQLLTKISEIFEECCKVLGTHTYKE